MSKLFTPLRIGGSQLAHRIALAPLTRFRANDDGVPGPLVKDYYEQRASFPGTLIVTEGTIISRANANMPNVPGIWSDEQISGWRAVVDAVHAKGGVIYCQLWAQGRAGVPQVAAANGNRILSSSAVPISPDGAVPEEMTEAEIRQLIADYATAARNAVAAGFDGVEVHGANGYVLDQFLQDTCNKRTDAWGGSVEARARLHLEAVKAVIEAVGADRTALRLSPYSDFQGMLMADPDPTFRYLVEQLRPLKLAYLHLVEARISGNTEVEGGPDHEIDWLVKLWGNTSPVVVAGGHSPDSAKKAVDERLKDYDVIVAFGRHFMPNPDLVFRIKEGVELTKYDRSVFYTPKDPKGYADYPFSSEYQAWMKVN